jgi:hypothetical protein
MHVLSEEPDHLVNTSEEGASPAQAFLTDLRQHRRVCALDRLIHGLSFAPDDATSRLVREGRASNDRRRRQSAVEHPPRAVTACVGAHRTRVLRLHGYVCREVLNAHPAMISEVTRLLAQRLHGRDGGGNPSSTPSEPGSTEAVIDSNQGLSP